MGTLFLGFKKKHKIVLVVSLLCLFHNTPKSLSHTDKSTFNQLLSRNGTSEREVFRDPTASFSEEIDRIKLLQGFIQAAVPVDVGIPKGRSRQPCDVIALGSGLCYDYAYTLAKLYRYLGWKTRHIALYQNDPDRYNALELFDRQIKSHASLEVKTQRGWLIVDPDKLWIGLATDSLPHGYFEVQNQSTPINWLEPPPTSLAWHLSEPPIVVYGLYSRHGRFFPPYNFVPDVNWGEMRYNL